jgi:hypothetical protein
MFLISLDDALPDLFVFTLRIFGREVFLSHLLLQSGFQIVELDAADSLAILI